MDDLDDFIGFIANEDIHDEIEHEKNKRRKAKGDSVSYSDIYSVPSINDMNSNSNWFDNDDEEEEDFDYSFDDDEEEERKNAFYRILTDMSGTEHKVEDVNGTPNLIHLNADSYECVLPKSVCDEDVLFQLKEEKSFLRFDIHDDDVISVVYCFSRPKDDDETKSSSGHIIVMEFTDADIVESCLEGKIGHTWGFVNDYRETEDGQLEINFGIISLPHPKYIEVYYNFVNTKLDKYLLEKGFKNLFDMNFKADSVEEKSNAESEKKTEKKDCIKVLLLGFSYHCDEDYLKRIKKDDVFVLVPEPENNVDKHAIAAYKNGLLRAYVMKEHAKNLSGIIKAPTECYVENVSDSAVWVRIDAL